jgi:predicted GIY-YIG superfamily endonuclease
MATEYSRILAARQSAGAAARFEIDPPDPVAWTLGSLRGRPMPDPEAVVYLLAYARAWPYYINVASKGMTFSLLKAYENRNAIYRIQKRRYGQAQETPLYLVYFEPYADYATAVARCKQLWAMPHHWQRQLVERFNGEWLNVIDELIAFPCSTHAVGEQGLVPLCAQARAAKPE